MCIAESHVTVAWSATQDGNASGVHAGGYDLLPTRACHQRRGLRRGQRGALVLALAHTSSRWQHVRLIDRCVRSHLSRLSDLAACSLFSVVLYPGDVYPKPVPLVGRSVCVSACSLVIFTWICEENLRIYESKKKSIFVTIWQSRIWSIYMNEFTDL